MQLNNTPITRLIKKTPKNILLNSFDGNQIFDNQSKDNSPSGQQQCKLL